VSSENGPAYSLFAAKLEGDIHRSGEGNFLACCPIHGEKPGQSKPSFSFNAQTGLWVCFAGCGGGGLRKFLLHFYPESRVNTLYDLVKAGLRSPKKRVESFAAVDRPFVTATPLPERLLGLFDGFLPTDLLDAGFDKQLLLDHDVGVDQERQRVTYPIRDISGALAGIAGRDMTGMGDGPKYKIYKQELIDMELVENYDIDKSHFLWRGDKVYALAREQRLTVYVTEGYKAALWCVQTGVAPGTVALMGSSISAHQVALLSRIANKVVCCLDNNPAGWRGTAKLVSQVVSCPVSILDYPEGTQQPDDIDLSDLAQLLHKPISFRQWRKKVDYNGFPSLNTPSQHPGTRPVQGLARRVLR
jgi:hypothetical protein